MSFIRKSFIGLYFLEAIILKKRVTDLILEWLYRLILLKFPKWLQLHLRGVRYKFLFSRDLIVLQAYLASIRLVSSPNRKYIF